jgi:hypothetical protein
MQIETVFTPAASSLMSKAKIQVVFTPVASSLISKVKIQALVETCSLEHQVQNEKGWPHA